MLECRKEFGKVDDLQAARLSFQEDDHWHEGYICCLGNLGG